jgi:uncharacterized protein YegL
MAKRKEKPKAQVMKPKAEQKRTNILFVLDSSGSMSSIRDAIIGGFNEQLNVLKARAKDMGETTVTMVLFGHNPETEGLVNKPKFRGRDSVVLLLDRIPIANVSPLSAETYVPFGQTALLDAIAFGLDVTSLQDSQTGNVSNLAIILTDGQENDSRHANRKTVAEMVSRLKQTGRWAFSLIGSNFDLETAKDIMLDDVYTNFSPTIQGTQKLGRQLMRSATSFAVSRGSGQIGSSTYSLPKDIDDDQQTGTGTGTPPAGSGSPASGTST